MLNETRDTIWITFTTMAPCRAAHPPVGDVAERKAKATRSAQHGS